jgi:2-polyprenyl-3-methyl-5-hydroxy-6-metoxy-1,4-benzoquinol methylase
VSAAPAPAPASTPTGNTFDKYGSANPVVRRVMRGFETALDQLLLAAGPTAVLDVGCGEGVLSADWARRPGIGSVEGIDLDDPGLRSEWAGREGPGLAFRAGEAGALPYAADTWDLVAAVEVLEHVSSPEVVLAEMARVARRHLLVSVPREPVWRALNVARGAYLTELGNTPGHLHHWSARGIRRLLERHGTIVATRAPFPWTMALVRV